MYEDRFRRQLATAGALCATVLFNACGGGGDSGLAPTDTAPLTAATLLDDDGGVMPSDPRAVPADGGPVAGFYRYATAAQSRDFERALGDDVHRLDVGCCDDVALEQAVAGLLSVDPGRRPAVLVSGADARRGATVVERLVAAGLDRVWWVSQ